MILLTGATGFLGSRLLSALLVQGEQVVAVKRPTSSTARIRNVLDHPGLHLFDIDAQNAGALFERHQIDTIVHTATEYGRGATPLFSILDANLALPLRLAELGIRSGVRTFINTDSFFNKGSNSYAHLLNYSLSKKSLLIWLEKLASDLKIVNVVLEHIYGPEDGSSKFVEGTIRAVAIERVPRLALTHGHQRRDFIYLDDAVSAYLALVRHARQTEFDFETFELGTGTDTQVRDLVGMVKELSRSPTELGFGDIAYRADEIMVSTANTAKLERLGWRPTTTLRDGLGRILEAYGVDVNV